MESRHYWQGTRRFCMARTTRREFLKQSSAASIGFFALAGVQAQEKKESANDKLNIACVGVGGKGSSDTDDAGGVGNVVAICDIDDKPLDAKAQKFPQAKKYNDFRKMLEEMEKGIDAVVVSTPDHTHAPAAAMAMKMKKHVYVQKPLTHTVFEARHLRELAKKQGVCTQMGNQGTAGNSLRECAEIVQAGLLGNVREVYVWTNRPIWPQSPGTKERPKETPAVPANVHWDLFLGPAPERAYHPAYHPFKWRGWWDYGTGALGDMACHTANMAFMACNLGYPKTIQAESGPVNAETYPAYAKITFEFPGSGSMPPIKFVWYEGKRDGVKLLPPSELFHGESPTDSGSLLVGSKGILYSPNDY